MAKFNLAEQSIVKAVIDYKGAEIELDIRSDITPEQIDKMNVSQKERFGIADPKDPEAVTKAITGHELEMLAETVCFFLSDWNLADKAGDIPLETAEVYKRVGVMILRAVFNKIEETNALGGLEKKDLSLIKSYYRGETLPPGEKVPEAIINSELAERYGISPIEVENWPLISKNKYLKVVELKNAGVAYQQKKAQVFGKKR